MSDIRKWIKIVESVPSVIIKKDATVMVDPSVGGGSARYMHDTPNGAMVDIKGVARELQDDDFSLPERDYNDPYENGNDWFHASIEQDTPGTMNDKPEFRPGDMVKIADVYGAVIGPGFGVFIGYGTTGKDCIVLFDGKQIVVPVENVAAVLEQDSKDNFETMDNDGNLSPMSFGSDNVKIEEPRMNNRDEFSQWISTVEEALAMDSGIIPVDDVQTDAGECGCENWDCDVCFPNDVGDSEDQVAISVVDVPGGETDGVIGNHGHDTLSVDNELQMGMNDIEFDMSELEEVGMEEENDPVMAFQAAGGKVQQLPYKGGRKEKNAAGRSMASSHIGGVRGAKSDQPGKGRLPPGNKPVVGEEDEHFIERPKHGKDVTLGHIVRKTEFRKIGQESPLTHGEDNLDEEGWYNPSLDDLGGNGNEEEQAFDWISVIKHMQETGTSMASRDYSEAELAGMNLDELKQVYDEVTGEIAEEEKPAKTKSRHHLDDLEDLFAPKNDNPLVNVDADDDIDADADNQMSLPSASADETRDRLRNMTPSDTMRDYMDRVSPEAGGEEPELPDTPTDALTIRTANDVPAVVSNAMRATGMQTPKWHHINNLPGYQDRNVRGMGRSIFSMFTSTPLEDIRTIANVEGQGPNTDAEIRAAAGWLRDNAEDLGEVDVSHGMAVPGYRPEVKEYRANGIRFQVVRDPMGQYIYAYPEADARLGGAPADQRQIQGRRNMPRLGEDIMRDLRPTMLEQLRWDEEINAILRESELEESTLSKLIGKKKGGQRLVSWLHKKHKLSNEAELEPVSFTKQLLWTEFKSHPDDFVIVSGGNGVAGIKPSEKHIEQKRKEKAKKGQSYNPANDTSLPYQIIAFTDDGEQVDPALLRPTRDNEDEPETRDPDPTVNRARMGKNIGSDLVNTNNTFRLLNDQIGPINTVWISGFSGYRGEPETVTGAKGSVERDKMQKRQDMKKVPEQNPQQALKMVFNKVRPVMKTLANQALLQINNRARRYIEGGNFEAAQKIAGSGANLKQFLAAIDTSGDVNLLGYNNPAMNALKKAIAVASGKQPDSEGFNKYITDIAGGNAASMRPVLDAFRDTLVGL